MAPENPKLPTAAENAKEIQDGTAEARAKNEAAKKDLIKELTRGQVSTGVGVKGEKGEPGPKGEKGEKGEKGDKGHPP